MWGVGSGGTNEVPPVASDIEEYGETSIILGARFCNELDPGTDHPVIDRIEVFNSEEEANASSYLGSYGRLLMVAVGTGQQEACLGVGGPDHNPPLGTAIVGERGRIVDKFESKEINEELDCRVVVVNDDGD